MPEKEGREREIARKHAIEDAEEVKEILSAVSTHIPTLIKSIISSVFSEEAGRNMGKAAGAFYKELKDSGIPNDVAIKMTEDYMKTFTGLGDLLKKIGKGGSFSQHVDKEVQKKIEEKIAEKTKERA